MSGEEEYAGPARLVADATTVEVEVRLRGTFQPIDGRYHWYGRVARGPAAEAVEALVDGHREVRLVTPEGEASVRLSDRDLWGRYRVTGAGRPPFRVGDAPADQDRGAPPGRDADRSGRG